MKEHNFSWDINPGFHGKETKYVVQPEYGCMDLDLDLVRDVIYLFYL